jgi:hypothetical protein
MSVTDTPTKSWSDPDSLLGPILVGAHEVGGHFLYPGAALRAAAGSIPDTATHARAVWRKQQHPRTRKVLVQAGGQARPFLHRVQLVEVGENEPTPIPLGHLLWSVGLTELGPDVAVLGPGVQGFILEVGFTRVASARLASARVPASEARLVAALQLALLRHLWVEYMRAYDPELIVMGGQTRFEESWWRALPEPKK